MNTREETKWGQKGNGEDGKRLKNRNKVVIVIGHPHTAKQYRLERGSRASLRGRRGTSRTRGPENRIQRYAL